MKRVYKYFLGIDDIQEVLIPKGGKILTVQTQGDQLWLWALVNPDVEPEVRTIRIAGTGHPITEENLSYISTTQQLNGELVWHIFEVLK